MAGANELENLKRGLKESFGKIREDFNSINKELDEKDKRYSSIEKALKELKESNEKLIEENSKLKQKIIATEKAANGNKQPEVDYEKLINSAIEKAMKKAKPRNSRLKDEFVRKFEKKKKDLIKQRILELVKEQEMTIPEIKEIVVDKEEFCSKATFYRYIERLQNMKKIDCVEINERRIVINKK